MSTHFQAALANIDNGTIVHLYLGMPVTDSLTIAREFGRRHDNVLQSLDALIADGTIGHLEFKESSYKNEQNRMRRAIELTERGALISMPFIGGKNSRTGQVRLVNAFLAMRDKMNRTHSGDWLEFRQNASSGYRMMSDALQEIRADDGKTTKSHHYANEAKLVNWVLFGHFESIDRDHLAQADLMLLEVVEARNAIWIARGRTYDQRKEALPAFLQSIRAKQGRIAQ